MILVCIFPLMLLSLATINILVDLSKRKRARQAMQSSSQGNTSTDDNINATLLTIVIVFIVSQLSTTVTQMIWYFADYPGYHYVFWSMYDLAWLLVHVNSAVNGFIYMVFNKRFGSALFSRCHCQQQHRNGSSVDGLKDPIDSNEQ